MSYTPHFWPSGIYVPFWSMCRCLYRTISFFNKCCSAFFTTLKLCTSWCCVCVHVRTAGAGIGDALFNLQCAFHLRVAENIRLPLFRFTLKLLLPAPKWTPNWTLYNTLFIFFLLNSLSEHSSSLFLSLTLSPSPLPSTTPAGLNRSLMYHSLFCWKVNMAF